MRTLSIIVPTLNEAGNITDLVKRIDATMRKNSIHYEIVFVDDHSTDGTADIVKSLSNTYPISLHLKRGARGKAYSLLQGFKLAKHDVMGMIDADLQYPPEAFGPMFELLEANKVDVVLTERRYNGVSKIRQIATKGFNLIFTRLLFGFNYDTQSGMKLFRKRVVISARLNPTPWSFDLEFIVRALENNYKILTYCIPFSERLSGEAKVRVVKVAHELAKASLRLKLYSSSVRIKRGYHMNMKLAEKVSAAGCIILIGLFAFGAVATSRVNHQWAARPSAKVTAQLLPVGPISAPSGALPELSVSPLQFFQPVQPMGYAADATVSTAGPGQLGLDGAKPAYDEDSRQTKVAAPASKLSMAPASSVYGAGGSGAYARPASIQPTYAYSEAESRLFDASTSRWLLALSAIALSASLFLFSKPAAFNAESKQVYNKGVSL